MRRRCGVLALAGVLLLVTACGGTEPDTVPRTVTFRDQAYVVSCAPVHVDRLGRRLRVSYEFEERFPAGEFGVEARSIQGVDPSEAIALEFEEDICGRGDPWWMPALQEDISDERELEIYDLVASPSD